MSRYKLMSSVYGRIEAVLLTYRGSARGTQINASQLEKDFAGIWNALDRRTKIFVFGNFADER